MSWRSLHVYYHGRQEILLVECIRPCVAWRRSQGLRGWFFLRHWKQGPHIRLRVKLEGPAVEEQLAGLERQISKYLAEHPSGRTLPAERLQQVNEVLAELEGDSDPVSEIVPNNEVCARPYEPEYSKYGGPAGVALAEDLFERSSDIVVDLLGAREQTSWQRLGTAFAMMLAALCSAGFDERQIAEFLDRYSRFWARYAADDERASWPLQFERERQRLTRTAAGVLSRRWEASPIGDALEQWSYAVRTTLELLDARGDEILPQVTLAGATATAHERRDFVLFNYLHTHNNRFGVAPAHESYLAYLGHCAMRSAAW